MFIKLTQVAVLSVDSQGYNTLLEKGIHSCGEPFKY